MAQAPTIEMVTQARAETFQALEVRKASKKKYAIAPLTDDEGHGPGVLPEKVLRKYTAKRNSKSNRLYKASDGDRVFPVNYFFLHHSTGPEMRDASDIDVADWYSRSGFGRAYQNGAINPRHEHPFRPGELTYSQAQFAAFFHSDNKYNFKIIDLIKDPWNNVAWAVGNWFYNQRSSSVEINGNFLGQILPEKALMCIADFLRPIDQELAEAGHGGLFLWLHQEVYATACPARIAEQRDTIVDMINNPGPWNQKLFGEPAPQPPAPPEPTPPPAGDWQYKVFSLVGQQLGAYKLRQSAWNKYQEVSRQATIVNKYGADVTQEFLDEFSPGPQPDKPTDPVEPTPPTPPTPPTEKTLWQQVMELFEKIKRALGG